MFFKSFGKLCFLNNVVNLEIIFIFYLLNKRQIMGFIYNFLLFNLDLTLMFYNIPMIVEF